MTDTVRGAVFGNVGTIISFRVSADDAPLLANQFEPQFTPSDLLQLHNRHFVISMVINTEKVPAFSATSLSLPTPQIDNTGRIVEHTRYNYSRSRDDIEREIALAIAPPQHLQNHKQEPKNHSTLHNQQKPQTTHKPAETTTKEPINQDKPPRKKRTRSRNKKTPNTQQAQEVTTKRHLQNEDEGKLVINHNK